MATGSIQTGNCTVVWTRTPAPFGTFFVRLYRRAGLFAISLSGTRSRPASAPVKAEPTWTISPLPMGSLIEADWSTRKMKQPGLVRLISAAYGSSATRLLVRDGD